MMEDIKINLRDYKNVIIVFPIQVFNISAPIRDFAYRYKNDIKNVECIFTHFMKIDFINVACKLDNILDNKRKRYTSICVRFGKIVYEQNID